MTYITENQKKEIDLKYFPNGYFWNTKNFDPTSREKRLNDDFETVEEYEARIKGLRHNNALSFYYHIKNMNKVDFINEINSQYLNNTLENEDNAELWLSLTYDLVLKGFSVAGKIEDVNLRGAFIEWHKLRISELKNQPQQTEADKKVKKEFKDFFNTDVNIEIINNIQKYFKDLKGKKMAYLIYLLHKEYELMRIKG